MLHVLCDRNENMQMSKQNRYKHGKSVKNSLCESHSFVWVTVRIEVPT